MLLRHLLFDVGDSQGWHTVEAFSRRVVQANGQSAMRVGDSTFNELHLLRFLAEHSLISLPEASLSLNSLNSLLSQRMRLYSINYRSILSVIPLSGSSGVADARVIFMLR